MDYIKNTVTELVNKYNTRDPFEVCDRLSVKYCLRNMHSDINGLYQYARGNKFIYINSNLSHEMRKIICAHELGHSVLHVKMNCTFLKKHTFINTNKLEKEANIFASELIIKDDLTAFNGQTLDEISAELKLPKEFVMLKFQDCFAGTSL